MSTQLRKMSTAVRRMRSLEIDTMKKYMLHKGLMLVATAVISACTMTGNPEQRPLPSLTGQFSQPFMINASNVIIDNRYDPLSNPKDVSTTFPTPPDLALKRYAETRIKPAGGEGVLRFIIEDASVLKETRPSPSEVARWFNMDDKDRYIAEIKLVLLREGVAATVPGAIQSNMRVERTLTIAESTSLAERDNLLQGFVSDLLRDIDKAVVEALRNTLKLSVGDDVAPSPGPWPVEPVDITPHGMNH